jgi:hypothetical protein
MGSVILSIALLILAAFFKAVADTLLHHFETSIFKKKDVRWWNPEFSWKYVKFIPLTKYRLDAWHLFNSLMIVCFICFGVFYEHYIPWTLEVIAAGIIYNLVFNLFYNKLLRK